MGMRKFKESLVMRENDMNLSGSNSSFGNNNVSLILDIISENDIDELGENNLDFNKIDWGKIFGS